MKPNDKQLALTWKYFWEQKTKEIVCFVLIVSAIIFIPFLLGHYIGDNVSHFCSLEDRAGECNIINQWFEGLLYCFIIGLVILLIGGWLSDNWDKAKDRAREELKKKGKKK